MSTKKSLIIPDIYNLIVYWYNIPSLLKKDFLELGTENMEKNFIVYKHTAPNGKVYIGITCQKPNNRWRGGNHYDTQPFYRAIVKYGWDNFEHEILYSGLTKEEAEQKEIELISFYKSHDKKYGYNIKLGGRCGAGYHLSDEVKTKRSNAQKGKKLTEEHRKAISIATKGRDMSLCIKLSAEKRLGTHRPKEERAKISNTMKQKYEKGELKNGMSKRVIGYKGTITKVFESASEASKYFNVTKSAITSCIKGRSKTSAGYRWKYADDN